MDEADRHVGDAVAPEPARHLEGRSLVELAQDLAAEAHPLRHLAHAVERHETLRLHPEVGVAVALRHGLARDLQQVAKALGGDESEVGEALLEQRVGGHGRPVSDRAHAVGVPSSQPEDLQDRVEHAHGGIGYRRRGLGSDDRARRLVQGHHVGQRPAGIDSDSEGAVEAPSEASPRIGCAGEARARTAVT